MDMSVPRRETTTRTGTPLPGLTLPFSLITLPGASKQWPANHALALALNAVLNLVLLFGRYYEQNSFNTQPYGECVERYGNNQNGRVRHFSKHNNPESCAENGGEWVNFYNFIEKDESE